MVSRLALALALIAGPAGAAAAATTTIGTAAAVNPASTSIAPGSASRVIRVGNNVVRDERIRTSAAGSVQLLFVDRTTMSIGPDSDVVLDSYVYNPDASTGRMAVTFGKGLMRFVGGEVTHNGEADIKTSAGVIGIRGGVVLLEAGRQATDSAAVLKITVAFGHAFLRGRFGLTTLSLGQTALVGRDGRVSVRLTTTADVQHHNSAMEKGAGHGGVHLSAGIVAAQLGSGANGTLSAPPMPPAPVPNTANNPSSPPVTPSVVQTTSTSQGTKQTSGGGDNNGGGGGSVAGTVFAYRMDNCCGSGHGPASFAPYLPKAFFGASTTSFATSDVLGFSPKAGLPAGFGTPVIQAGVDIEGDGANQRSTFLAMAGEINGGKLSGSFFASRHSTDTSPVTIATGSFTSSGSGSSAAANHSSVSGAIVGSGAGAQVGAGTGNGAASVGSQAASAAGGGTTIPASGTITSSGAQYDIDNGGLLPSASQTYQFSQGFSRITAPAGIGKVRPDLMSTSTELLGFAGGIVDTINHGTGTVQHLAIGSLSTTPGGFVVAASADAGFLFAAADVQKVAGSGSFNAVYEFGFDATTSGVGFYRGGYIDSDHFAALLGKDSSGKPLALVNGTTPASAQGAVVSSGFVNVSGLKNVTACACQYTKWGFWAVQDVQPGGNIEHRAHLLEWVAGQMPDLTGKDIPTVGKASYSGHVVASVQNGGAAYVAAGRFNSTVDFGASTGNVKVRGLDNMNYQGKIALDATNRASFASVKALVGHDATTDAATRLRMTLNGAFYGSKASPAQEMGGQVVIRGLTAGGQQYLGSGVFAAAK